MLQALRETMHTVNAETMRAPSRITEIEVIVANPAAKDGCRHRYTVPENDGTGRFDEVSGQSLELPDMTYALIIIAGKSSVTGFSNISTGQYNTNGFWTNN